MAGIELSPSKPPRAFDISTRELMIEAFTELIDDYDCQGAIMRMADGKGGYVYRLSMNRNGEGPPAESNVSDTVRIVADVSGLWALTDEEIEARYS